MFRRILAGCFVHEVEFALAFARLFGRTMHFIRVAVVVEFSSYLHTRFPCGWRDWSGPTAHRPAMAPKPTKRGAEPVPAGLQPDPSSSWGGGSASSSSGLPQAQRPAAEAPPKKSRWFKSIKGKKRLARAIRHRNLQQVARLAALTGPPVGEWSMGRSESRLEHFRRGPRRNLARALLFLLQVVIRIVTHFRPGPQVIAQYGLGVSTPPRLAILLLLEGLMNEATWESLTSQRRQLFLRALKEGESTKRLSEILGEEIVNDIQNEAKAALQDLFVTTLGPLVRARKLPVLDFAREDVDKQYDNVWKETTPYQIMFL